MICYRSKEKTQKLINKDFKYTFAWDTSTHAWKIQWTEEPGRLLSMGSHRVGHDWATSLSLSCIGEGNGNPLQYSCLENPRDGGAWWAAIYGVAQSRTWLKRLSSSSSSSSRAAADHEWEWEKRDVAIKEFGYSSEWKKKYGDILNIPYSFWWTHWLEWLLILKFKSNNNSFL